MANSAHLGIRSAVAALLLVGPAVAGGNVLQNRAFGMAQGIDSQVHVNFDQASPDASPIFTGHPRDWVTTIEVAILARKAGGVEAADVADALWVDVYARVMANQSLGGRVQLLTPGDCYVQAAEADTSVCKLTWSFTCVHRTANDSIT